MDTPLEATIGGCYMLSIKKIVWRLAECPYHYNVTKVDPTTPIFLRMKHKL